MSWMEPLTGLEPTQWCAGSVSTPPPVDIDTREDLQIVRTTFVLLLVILVLNRERLRGTHHQ
jgi:hypothetical protein